MALCSLDLGRMRELRSSEATRAAPAAIVSTNAHRKIDGAKEGSISAASAVASVKPEAQPSSM
jgi:hypothetical protein